MQHALSLLAQKGVNQREAAKIAGLSEYHLSRELKKPQIQAFIARKARETIALGVLRASSRVLELVDADSEHVSLDASKHVLAIEGIKPPENGTNINIINNVQPGYVIRLDAREDAAVIAHDQRNAPKPLIEHESVRSVGPIPDRTYPSRMSKSEGESDA